MTDEVLSLVFLDPPHILQPSDLAGLSPRDLDSTAEPASQTPEQLVCLQPFKLAMDKVSKSHSSLGHGGQATRTGQCILESPLL